MGKGLDRERAGRVAKSGTPSLGVGEIPGDFALLVVQLADAFVGCCGGVEGASEDLGAV